MKDNNLTSNEVSKTNDKNTNRTQRRNEISDKKIHRKISKKIGEIICVKSPLLFLSIMLKII